MGESQGGADISDDGRYRYRLWREVVPKGPSGSCLFVMLNPSTADAMKDDPTIRKCVGFCKRWGFERLFVVNLFAFRSTDPGGLREAADPRGPENDGWVHAEVECCNRVVLAWGSHHEIRDMVSRRAFELRRTLERFPDKTGVLGRCKDGNPRHPLMLAYTTPLESARP